MKSMIHKFSKSDLSAQIASSIGFSEQLEIDEPTMNTNLRMFHQYIDVLKVTHQEISDELIEQAIQMIRVSQRIVLYGVANSALFCHYLSNQFLKLGLNTSFDSDTHTTLVAISQLSEHDVVILISESGETKEIINAAIAAQLVKAKVIAITGSARNTLYEHADLILSTIVFETDTRMNLLTVRISQLFVVDLLIVNIIKTDFQYYLNHIQGSDNIIKNLI